MISSNLPFPSAANIAAYPSPAARRSEGLSSLVPASTAPSPELSSRDRTTASATDLSATQRVQGANESADTGAEAPDDEARLEKRLEEKQLQAEQEEIRELSARDREVRAHEQAHVAVGGQFAGAASFDYQRGPDGVRYAVSGEVPIDVGREPTPEATIEKMQVVKRAALAPAEPSAQDRRVAAEASRQEAEARQELRSEQAKNADNDADGDMREVSGDDSDDTLTTRPTDLNESINPNRERVANASLFPSSTQQLTSRLDAEFANASGYQQRRGSILDQIV
ncbi:putative metalloprotease CJM1_0395 family protein [Teredinibacter turnerae]|uniref:putative metalloprotease CJM1_0395 family protein n=1 Tax=Teredinibacter turnerae TaxID=2426 RepID=UPI0009B92C15|nr:putative metalloprotease CJM1_0395 family protein [Teredinibacter turnerae]